MVNVHLPVSDLPFSKAPDTYYCVSNSNHRAWKPLVLPAQKPIPYLSNLTEPWFLAGIEDSRRLQGRCLTMNHQLYLIPRIEHPNYTSSSSEIRTRP